MIDYYGIETSPRKLEPDYVPVRKQINRTIKTSQVKKVNKVNNQSNTVKKVKNVKNFILLSLYSGLISGILGSVIHLIRMKVSKQDHVLAFGPYLSVGIFISALWGSIMIGWYLQLIGR